MCKLLNNVCLTVLKITKLAVSEECEDVLSCDELNELVVWGMKRVKEQSALMWQLRFYDRKSR